MMKVLYIHHAAGIGGAPISLIKLIENLDRNKYEVIVLLIKESDVVELLNAKNIKYTVVSGRFYKYYYRCIVHSEAGYLRWYNIYRIFKGFIYWFLSKYYFAERQLKHIDFNIVHLNSSVLTDWLYASHKLGKTVIHIREPFACGYTGLRKKYLINQMKKYADHIIAISKDNANRIGLPEKTTVIYNFNNTGNGSYNAEFSFDKSKKVLYLGGASKIKGFYTLIKALDYIDDDVLIYFGGYYPVSKKRGIKKYLPKNKRLAESLNILRNHPQAVEIGLISNVYDFMNKINVLVSPHSVEHFSRPIIEAFWCGKPAIGTNVTGMEEIIDHEVNGLIVEKDNPVKLANAINFLCSNPKTAKRMGEEGYKKARALYSENNVKKIEAVYEKITESKNGK